jgi:hypothetical protein
MAYTMPSLFSKTAMTTACCAVKKQDGSKEGAWTRLAHVSGSAAEPYVIAVRALKDGRIQFACGCPHWKFRCQSAGLLCKHQQAVLAGGLLGGNLPEIKWTKEGQLFLTTLAKATMEQRVARHVAAKAAA